MSNENLIEEQKQAVKEASILVEKRDIILKALEVRRKTMFVPPALLQESKDKLEKALEQQKEAKDKLDELLAK